MTNHTPSGQIKFEEDYSAVVFGDGSVVKFTRLERRALEALSKSAGRILTRSQILDTISEPGSEKNDRNIDFLISTSLNNQAMHHRDFPILFCYQQQPQSTLQTPSKSLSVRKPRATMFLT